MDRKSVEDVSIRDAPITGEPITRFFYFTMTPARHFAGLR